MRVKDGDRVVEIPELSEEEAGHYFLLGEATGRDESHCLMLALRYGERFLDRVIGYRKAPAEKGTRVTFYAEPTPRDWSPRKKPTRRRED